LQERAELGLRHQGYLFAALTEEGARQQRKLVEAQRTWGLTDVELLDSEEARRRFPYLAPQVRNARYRAGDRAAHRHDRPAARRAAPIYLEDAKAVEEETQEA